MAVQTYKKGDTTKLSKYFNVYEFRCGLGSPCSCTTTLIDDQLVTYLEKIREHFGAPVTVTSGYRCPSYNSRPSVGGTTGSRHTKGQAADIVVCGVAPRKVAAFAESIGVKGVGLYETQKDGYFTHIDTRTTKSFWYGQAQEARSTFGGAAAAGSAAKPSTTVNPVDSTSYTLEQFIRNVQAACGAAVDGIAGPETLSKTVTLSRRVNISHAAVEAVQRRLLALGYSEVGSVDGVAGQKFDQAVKRFQREHDCKDDGEITAKNKTWRKLLGMN